MKEHFSPKKNKIMPCDEAIIKYGIPEEIEILEEIQDKNKLQEREKYWINYYSTNDKNNGYNLTSGGEALYRDDNFWSVLNELEVIDIRKRRANLEKLGNIFNIINLYRLSLRLKCRGVGLLLVRSVILGNEVTENRKRYT